MKLFGITLGEGNQKVGEVFTFSLPSIISCPGASPWCKKHCNMTRLEKFRPVCRNAYQQNYLLTKNPKKFQETVTGVLPRILPCFRIHVSGDFYCKPTAYLFELEKSMKGIDVKDLKSIEEKIKIIFKREDWEMPEVEPEDFLELIKLVTK